MSESPLQLNRRLKLVCYGLAMAVLIGVLAFKSSSGGQQDIFHKNKSGVVMFGTKPESDSTVQTQPSVRRISILGERNSGTRWLYR